MRRWPTKVCAMDRSALPDYDVLAGLLRRLREDAGLSQFEVARTLGRRQPFVSKYERGQRRLDLIELRRICAALDIPLASLVRRFENALRLPAAAEPRARYARAGKPTKKRAR